MRILLLILLLTGCQTVPLCYKPTDIGYGDEVAVSCDREWIKYCGNVGKVIGTMGYDECWNTIYSVNFVCSKTYDGQSFRYDITTSLTAECLTRIYKVGDYVPSNFEESGVRTQQSEDTRGEWSGSPTARKR